MNRNICIHRIDRPRFNIYETDGLGRDTYISYNNGGFFVKNQKEIKYRPNYPYYHNINYHSLSHSSAPFKYYSDGSGRDSYVIRDSGGLRHDTKPLAGYHLKDFLRAAEDCIYKPQNNKLDNNGIRYKTYFVSKKELINNQRLFKIQKGIINRLYTSPLNKRIKKNQVKDGFIPMLRKYNCFEKEETKNNHPVYFKTTNDFYQRQNNQFLPIPKKKINRLKIEI